MHTMHYASNSTVLLDIDNIIVFDTYTIQYQAVHTPS
jgi:hypothetical protein